MIRTPSQSVIGFKMMHHTLRKKALYIKRVDIIKLKQKSLDLAMDLLDAA